LSTDGLSPSALRVVLAPVYHKITDADRGSSAAAGIASEAPPPPPVPANWYPDPNNARLQRYWDGKRWTEDTAPMT
jgi:hypothetical protein